MASILHVGTILSSDGGRGHIEGKCGMDREMAVHSVFGAGIFKAPTFPPLISLKNWASTTCIVSEIFARMQEAQSALRSLN